MGNPEQFSDKRTMEGEGDCFGTEMIESWCEDPPREHRTRPVAANERKRTPPQTGCTSQRRDERPRSDSNSLEKQNPEQPLAALDLKIAGCNQGDGLRVREALRHRRHLRHRHRGHGGRGDRDGERRGKWCGL